MAGSFLKDLRQTQVVFAHELHFFRRFDLLQSGEMQLSNREHHNIINRFVTGCPRGKAAKAMRSHTSETAQKRWFEAERSEITLKNKVATNRLDDRSFRTR